MTTTEPTTMVNIAVPDWVVAQFQSTGLAPLSWSQQAVTEAIRSALQAQAVPQAEPWPTDPAERTKRLAAMGLDEYGRENVLTRQNREHAERLAKARARLSEANIHAIVMAAYGRRFISCNLTQLSNITGLSGATVKNTLERLMGDRLITDIGKGSAWRVRLAPEMVKVMREAGLI
jgi:hypothetical protein